MNRFLPSKKLLVFLAVTLVVLVCLFVSLKLTNKQTNPLTDNPVETTSSLDNEISQTLKNDTDRDGLKDWEEILWKTDLHNPDTDKDGTDDNTEILAGRNPLVVGPNDWLEKNTTFIQENKSSEEIKILTQTDLLSRELFAGYVALKQNDQLGTEQEEQFINNLVTKHLTNPINPEKNYEKEDLNIVPDNQPTALQTYTANLKKIAQRGDSLENDAVIVKNALDTKNYQELEKLDLNIKTYTEMLEQLLAMEIPENLVSFHLKIINTFNKMIQDVSDMRLIANDPIAGIKSVQDYFNNTKILTNELSSIN